DSLNLGIGIAMTILPFLGPAISLRSPARALTASLFTILVFAFVLVFAPPIKGRDELPLTVWGSPYANVWVPWYDDLHWNWQTRAYIGFSLYWFGLGVSLLVISTSLVDLWHCLPRIVMSAGTVALVASPLYILTWGAKATGTRGDPASTATELWSSLTVYAILFAVLPWLLFFVYERLPRRVTSLPPQTRDTTPA
ncbi:MAG TPA: hypothetical protein PK869_04710, partial [Candidatus Hydrogenedentes bacterium]|nr:hypothetical protein [Candidatus Hydrogenedentota bacterium]